RVVQASALGESGLARWRPAWRALSGRGGRPCPPERAAGALARSAVSVSGCRDELLEIDLETEPMVEVPRLGRIPLLRAGSNRSPRSSCRGVGPTVMGTLPIVK